jgi:hypothetical protein
MEFFTDANPILCLSPGQAASPRRVTSFTRRQPLQTAMIMKEASSYPKMKQEDDEPLNYSFADGACCLLS